MLFRSTEKFTIGTTIRNILINDGDINAKIKNKIYPLIAPEDTTGTFIIYQRDEYSKQYTNQGIYEESCIIYLTIVSDNYDESQQLAIMINDLLEGYTDEFTIRLTDSTEDYFEGKFIQVLKFEID